MRMTQGMVLSQEMQQKLLLQLQISGGHTGSIFPEVERLMFGDSDCQRALEYVSKNKNLGKYRSVMDFLFCEIFYIHRGSCFRYYKGNGPPLRELVSEDDVKYFNMVLLKALEIALEFLEKDRRASWSKFRNEVFEKIAA